MIADRVREVSGVPVGEARPVGGGDVCAAYRLDADGRTLFAKTLADAPEGFFRAEADGLALLAGTGVVAVPAVVAAARDVLVLDWIEPGRPSPGAAERLGRDLAALHDSPAEAWGTPGRPAFLGPLPLPSPDARLADPGDWPAFHAAYRLLPFLRRAADAGAMADGDVRAVEGLCARIDEVAGPPQRPAVIHGDLWSGNVHWSATGRASLIDPAAQGGHPETDLAMLELFGCPHLDRVLAAYEEVRPVPGRAARTGLHQLQHLLVHAVLFGGGYGARCGQVARAALA
ncbi:fructosamine kinase family protein [Streptomyces sp. DSM 42041]|uniref:Fructosamine kinase family protein n=1 Tax=Streptomyces hazeniae TaxID=3075538 RepID=A0ABU2NQ85_9ACTN|nr:fructosamine kinase family protein [Streptomyces sp. DSM 42041]MDT0378919.1 fructosamine kinase family protein [Streptomyces sp. DSM 42041]